MRILCTNDDGIHAEGLGVLERVARRFTDDVWVVAPETEQSGASRALTLTAPIRVRAIGEKRFALSGTPTDCVQLGVQDLIAGARPDLVLSGVNHGSNIADDVTFSGTIAGAMQGMQLGIRSIALSQARGFREGAETAWATAAHFAPGIIAALIKQPWPEGVLMNVNFPDREPGDVHEVVATSQGRRDKQVMYADQRTDLRGRAYYWLGYRGERSTAVEGTDLRAIYDGKISVTPLHIALTHDEALHKLRGVLGGAPPVRL